jgi:drug/metabolite transporter (DMT)-like permease
MAGPVTGAALAAVLLSFSAATLFAVTTNLHRGAASAVPVEDGGPLRLLLRLLRTPRWLLGSLAAMIALTLHTVALRFGTVIVVQAVLSTGLVLALALECLRERRRPTVREVGSWLLVVAGIIALLSLARPHGGRNIGLYSLVLTLVLAVLIASAGLLCGRTRLPRTAVAVVMGGAAGALFALDAVFLKALAMGGSHLLEWRSLLDLGGFLLCSILGNLVVQRAYQQAPLRHVLPAVTAADPLAACVVGIALLHEHLQPGWLAIAGLVGGLVAMVVGIVGATAQVRDDEAGPEEAASPALAGTGTGTGTGDRPGGPGGEA